MSKKIIFLDIDGTLTCPGVNTPPDSALDAVKKAQEKGNKVFLCTGRNYDMMKPLLKFGFDGYIASGGGYIVCGDEVIFDCPMTPEQQDKVLIALENAGIYRTVECKNGSYTDDGFKEFLAEHASQGGNSELLRWREQLEKDLGIRSMKEFDNSPVYKVVIMGVDMEKIKLVKEELSDDFITIIQDVNESGIINGEIVNRAFDKGQGVKRVADFYNISIDDTVGYGDSMNDKEMLEVVGHSVCMDNGAQAMKDLSDEVCPSVENDGLMKSFEANGYM